MNPLSFIERNLAVREGGDLSFAAVARQLYLGQACEEGFLRAAAPVPPKFDTRLLVQRKAGELHFAALLSTETRRGKGEDPWRSGAVEIFFDLRNDRIGYVQFVFREGEPVAVNDFSPYPEARSTRWKLPQVKRWGFEPVESTNSTHFGTPRRIFHAVFREREIFGSNATVGFNFCRQDDNTEEYSSWSFLAGCGAQDAMSLGKLHRAIIAPAEPSPCLPPVRSFRLSVTNDVPMMIVGGPYTPETLDLEMRTLKSWGIGRLHWIDYSRFPAFWSRPLWSENHRETERACGGDLLVAACRAAKRHKIELVADFKLFDLGFTATWQPPRFARKDGLLPFMNGQEVLGIPEMVGNEEAFMQTNPAWRREVVFPIRTLRLYSSQPLPEIRLADLRLFQSADNANYTPLSRKGLRISVSEIRRGNLRWTPAGTVREKGTHRAWVLEITGLALTGPYLGVEIAASGGAFVNPHFALVEAEDAEGNTAPFICAQGKASIGSYPFFRKWPGWNNSNEPATAQTTLPFAGFGVAFLEPPALTGMLEPVHPKAREIWLGRVEKFLEHDVAGVGIRTLCHHRRCESWLQYAYAPVVVAEFERRYGHAPGVGLEDEARVRTLRGEAMGDFLSAAKALAGKKRKKLIFQVEAGSELPPTHESRMAIYYDYEKWIASGLFNELHIRAITGHSRWLRTALLPLARRHGVEVHLITRNQDQGLDARDQLDFCRIISDARKIGYHGLNIYESANLYEINRGGTLLPRAMAIACMEAAAREATREA